jgi:hypothetical protein
VAQAEEARVVASDLEALADAALPVETLDEALPHLRRPFTPEAIKFKVQTVWPKGANPTGCIVVAYIDARLVIERFNAVVGGRWAPEYRPTSNDKLLMCDLTVCDVTRPDVGQSAKGLSKDLVSDALKRSAVLFGVGVSVYALPQITLYLDQERDRVDEDNKPLAPRIQKRGQGDRTTIALTEAGHRGLRGGYSRWLEESGARLFGPALDHGDVEGATVDEEPEGEEFVPAAPAALEDEEAVQLIGQARELYAKIQDAEGAAAFPPAKFQAWLEQSWHSHDGLRELVAHLEQRAAGREA